MDLLEEEVDLLEQEEDVDLLEQYTVNKKVYISALNPCLIAPKRGVKL